MRENEEAHKTRETEAPDAQGPQPRLEERATFLVKILYRRNHSWQGEIVWAETNERQYFRSALELIRLIDSAMPEKGRSFAEDDGRK